MMLARYPLLVVMLVVAALGGCAVGLPDTTTTQAQGYSLAEAQRWGYE